MSRPRLVSRSRITGLLGLVVLLTTTGPATAQPLVRTADGTPLGATYTAPGGAAPTAATALQSPSLRGRIIPNRLVVRFADTLVACASTAFESGAAAPEPVAALISTLRSLGIDGVRPVHRTPAEQAALRRGRDLVTLDELLGHHRLEIERLTGRRGLTSEKLAGLPALHHVYTVELADGVDARHVLDTLNADPRVRWAEPVRLLTTEALPDDPLVDPDGDGEWQSGSWGQDHADQWALESMGWETVWDERDTLWNDPERVGGGGVTIAVIDSGVDYDHPDLAANIWRDAENRPGIDFVDIDVQAYLDAGLVLVAGEDYTELDHDPMDRQGHGTHVAGIAGATADDGFGMAGVAWGATILPVRAGFALDVGNGFTVGVLENDDVAAAIAWAAESGADILNFSFGGVRDPVLSDAVAYAHGLGALMVASAGNSDTDLRGTSPADEPWVLTVGATDVTGAKALFSNWGERLDLAAPGKDIVSTRAAGTAVSGPDLLVGEHHTLASGTSMAAPQVAGALALILSAHPEADHVDWRGRLVATAQPLASLLYGLDARLPLGAGTPRLADALRETPRPHGGLVALEIAPFLLPNPSLGGLTSLDAGQLYQLTASLRNLWRRADGTTFELLSDDPYLTVMDGVTSTGSWTTRALREVVAEVRIDDDVPRYHRPDVRLRIVSGGFAQEIPLPLEVNGARALVLVPENPASEFLTDFSLHREVDGRVLATWTHFNRDKARAEIRGAFFDRDGQQVGSIFLLHEDDDVPRSDVAAARRADGQWVAAWRRLVAGDPPTVVIEVQRFDDDGRRLGAPITIDDPDALITQQLAVALADDDTFAVGWWGSYTSTDSTIRLQWFDPSDQPLGEIREVEDLGMNHHSNPSLLFGADGNLLVTWRAHFGITDDGEHDINIYSRLYTPNGTPLTAETPVSQERSQFSTSPSVTATADGYVVGWDWCDSPFSLGGSGLCSVRARRVAADGTPLADETILEPSVDHNIDDVGVVTDDDGSFAAVWRACLPNTLRGCEIRARQFDADDQPTGAVHRIDSMNPLRNPSLVRLGDDYLVAWANSGRSPYAFWGQIFRLGDLPGFGPCRTADDALCLQTERFEITVEWQDFDGQTGSGIAEPLAGTTGYFSFFDPDNVEILVKVLDGRTVNGHWWVFTASLSNVEYRLRVRDTTTGVTRTYDNPLGRFASRGDVLAFADTGAAVRASQTSRTSPKITELMLHDRFRVEIAWRDFDGVDGVAEAVPLTDDSGAFWFFDSDNVELVIKILDGRPVNGHWWVYFGALSNVAYSVTVTDTETGTVRTYDNPLGSFASRGDVQAF